MYRDSLYTERNERIRVFVGSAIDTTSAVNLGIVYRHYQDTPVQNATGWFEYSFPIPANQIANGKYVFLEAISEFGNDMMIDNIVIEEAFNPMPPRNLSVALNDNAATLTWEAPVTRALSNYKVYRNNTEVATVAANTLTYTDAQLANGDYAYHVTAIYTNPNGESAATNSVNVHVGPVLYPPNHLTATVNADDVTLNWTEGGPVSDWITHGGVYADGIGTNGAAEFKAAQRFSAAQLAEAGVAGGQLTKVRFAAHEPAATYTVKVWTNGSMAPANPGTEVFSAVVPSITVDDWTEVVLPTPVAIPANGELWFGYNVNTPSGYPAGADEGPAVNTFGNLMYINNAWTTLSAVAASLNYNWCIQGFAVSAEQNKKAPIVLTHKNTEVEAVPVISLNNDFGFKSIKVNAGMNNNSRSLTGYKVYRGETLLTATPLPAATHTFTDNNVAPGNYTYGVKAVYTDGESQAATVQVTITQEVVITNLPWNEGFENAFPPAGWLNIDADGDNNVWNVRENTADAATAHTGDIRCY
jgi:hypothetical protein